MSFRHKNIRLPHVNYVGKQWFFVTLCCANRSKFFRGAKFCAWFVSVLRRDTGAHHFALHAYCLMPDHVHLLLEGLEPLSDMLEFVQAVKRKTSAAFLRKTGRCLWQKKFYDHILRRNESPDGVAWYIWMNPARAGMCQTPEEYPFVGSLTNAWGTTAKPFVAWIPA